ncbi:MAG: DEAD/DEAH box helicase [Saprospiraceae bacterium]|nr:DEAD/DEAH box helicase [Saprospiraceae bacterium]
MTFRDLGIINPLLRALQGQGYTHPTPIQEQSIPILLQGKDLLGCAQTGTGKTAAFALPILQKLFLDRQRGPRQIRALVVTPTRELAVQIGESFKTYGKFTGLKTAVIYGGVKQGTQTRMLRSGIDVLVATPGRLLDLIGQGYITLRNVEYSVLDEADRMLDMGFIHDIRKIIAKLPEDRQSLFFSATLPPSIVDLSRKMLGSNPEKISIKPEQATAERVDQSVYFVSKKGKSKLLVHLLESEPTDSTLVFSRTKHGANRIVKMLDKVGIRADAIHSNKSQKARQRALGNFKRGRTSVLVATDIASRGIDVQELSRVINYDLPNEPETYVHRIGRTGRANASGVALSFCDRQEQSHLRSIQKLIDQKIPVVLEHPYLEEPGQNESDKPAQIRRSSPPRGRYSSNRNKNNRRNNRNFSNSKKRNSSSRRRDS